VFNREVTDNCAKFWADSRELANAFNNLDPQELGGFVVAGRERIENYYQWEKVTDDYERLIKKLGLNESG